MVQFNIWVELLEHRSTVVKWLKHWPLMLKIEGLNPTGPVTEKCSDITAVHGCLI